jgi:PAS domain S-box-containing protein
MQSNRLSFGLTAEEEEGFHQYNLPADIKQAGIGVLLVILPLILFVFTDYQLHGASSEFIWLVVFRAGVVLYCLLQITYMARLSDYPAYYRSITAWALVIVAFNLIVNYTQPEALVTHAIVVSITVFILYLVIPNRFPIQIIICSAFSLGELLIIFFTTQPSTTMLFTVLIGIGLANFIAASSSWQLHAYRRKVFLNLTEQNRSEALVQRNKKALEGINRILREAVGGRTEEELGQVCLKVAEELTTSKFGLIGEINPEGHLNTLVTDPGWQAGPMVNSTGSNVLPSGLTPHGLFGHVLQDEKSLIINKPSSHLASIDVPPGHPSLTAFLGVPLTYRNRMVGMIALGNKEGGYTEEDKQAIEEIAPIIVETIQKKRAQKALRESREDLKQAQSVATTGSWRIKGKAGELKWSDETYRIFGIEKRKPMTYDLFLGTIHPDDRDRVDQKWNSALHGEPYDIEHRIIVKNEVKWVREKAEMEFGQDGTLQSALGTVQDITDLKLTEEKLRLRTEELARSNAELQQFAYVASHDLQEPLRMVINYLSLLQRKFPDKIDTKAQEYIHFAVDGGERMRQLIDDLLEYSRVDTRGKEPTPTPMNAVVAKTLALLEAPIEESKAEIVVDSLPTVTADESQMVQVMQNLVGNAIKFRGFERPRVQISVSPGTDEWIFAVRDNGIGLNMENADKIFQMFQRLHGRGEYPGTGVGLAIVKKIVERHGGRIWVESAEGKGATFFFTMPAKGVQRTRIG